MGRYLFQTPNYPELLDTARTASAAWKAKCKQLKEIISDRTEDVIHEYNRAEAAETYSAMQEGKRFEAVEKLEATEKRVAELEGAMRNLLSMAKYYKPIPKGYNPQDEDEETWSVGIIYHEVEAILNK